MSGGNKRKLCLAMSVIGEVDVIFMDEPTSGKLKFLGKISLF